MTNSNNNNDIHILIKKYMSNELTYEERLQLAEYIRGLDEDELKQLPIVNVGEFDSTLTLPDEVSRRILSNILHPQHSVKSKRSIQYFYVKVLAVAASLLIAIAAGFYFYNQNVVTKSSEVLVAKAVSVPFSTPTSFTRYITLSDGSTVILKAGGTLSVAKDFLKQTREVSLSGEAFFDVKHRNDKPFMIHTGNVRTTVLGTAFDIKADSKGVVVSVTRGRVKVERGRKILAVLNVADKVKCSMNNTDVIVQRHKTEEIAATVNWTRRELAFDHVSMLNVVRKLSRRYAVNITIPNKDIAATPLYISFEGTESISDVMTVICSMLPDMSYHISGKDIVITQNNN